LVIFVAPARCAEIFATPLSVDQLIAEAMENNPDILIMNSRLQALEGALAEGSAYANPTLEYKRGTDENHSGEIRLAQPLSLNGRIPLSRKLARAETAAYLKTIAVKKLDIAAAVKKNYYAARFAQERIKFEQEHYNSAANILSKIEARQRIDEARAADVSMARAEVSLSKFHMQAARSRADILNAELNVLLGRQPDSPLTLEEADLGIPEAEENASLEDYAARALRNSGELNELAFRAEANDAQLNLEKRKRIPDLTAGIAQVQEDTLNYTQFSLELEIPLWYRNGGAIKSALARGQALERERRRLELTINNEVRKAWLEKALAASLVRTLEKNLLTITDLRKNFSQDYLAGKIDLSVYYQINERFVKEHIEYIDAMQDYWNRTADFDRVLSAALYRENK